MDVSTFIILGILVAVLLYAVTIYNNLVRLKHNVDKAWANIDVLLKQRHDELPKLIETCKQYMTYEQETLDKVMQARTPFPTRANRAMSPLWGRRRRNCAWGWAICSPWPRPTRT